MARRRSAIFTRNDAGVDVNLDEPNRAELRQVAGMLLDLIEPGYDDLFPSPDAVATPEDPALERLFPAAYRGDAEAAAEYRRLTDGELRSGKRSDATRLQDTAFDAHLDEALAEVWIRALNDARLVLGSRLGLEKDEDSEHLYELAQQPDADPIVAAVTGMYLRLGQLQDLLIDALDGA